MITEKYISAPQIKMIHVLLGKLGFMGRKSEIICDVSHGRTTHCNELTRTEASYLIKLLEEKIAAVTARQPRATQSQTDGKTELINQIYSAAWEFGIIYGNTIEDRVINLYLINKFCLERGTVKKKLSQMTYVELKKTLQQFKAINRHKSNK